MVYNALKLFMELNPDLFDETMQHYKQNKIDERQHAVERYEGWLKLREKAVVNANGHLPEGFAENEPLPPPPAPPVDDTDIVDLSLELNAVSIDGEVQHNLDDSGIERVPMADPGLDRPLPEIGGSEQSPVSPGPHVRRKSVLPVDPSVLHDLQAHRSLDDSQPGGGGGGSGGGA